MATTFVHPAILGMLNIREDIVKMHPGVFHGQVVISVLCMSIGTLPILEHLQVSPYQATIIIGTDTVLDIEDGLIIDLGGGFIVIGSGGGSSVGMVDGLIGTRQNTYTDIVIKSEVIPLLKL